MCQRWQDDITNLKNILRIIKDSLLSTADSLQHTDSSSSLSLEALTDVVGVGSGPVLKQHLPGLAGSRQILQVLYLIGGPTFETATDG